MDEDRRNVNLLTAIVDGEDTCCFRHDDLWLRAVQHEHHGKLHEHEWLKRGRTYMVYVWATDFKGLRSSKTTTFTW